MNACPGLSELIGARMKHARGWHALDCSLCLEPIEEGQDTYYSVSPDDSQQEIPVHYECFMNYAASQLRNQRVIKAPPHFREKASLTSDDVTNLLRFMNISADNQPRARRQVGYYADVADYFKWWITNLPNAHPKEKAGIRREKERREREYQNDEEWRPGDD